MKGKMHAHKKVQIGISVYFINTQMLITSAEKKEIKPTSSATVHLSLQFHFYYLTVSVFSFIHSQHRVNVYDKPTQISLNPPKSICSFDSAFLFLHLNLSLSLSSPTTRLHSLHSSPCKTVDLNDSL